MDYPVTISKQDAVAIVSVLARMSGMLHYHVQRSEDAGNTDTDQYRRDKANEAEADRLCTLLLDAIFKARCECVGKGE